MITLLIQFSKFIGSYSKWPKIVWLSQVGLQLKINNWFMCPFYAISVIYFCQLINCFIFQMSRIAQNVLYNL